MGDDVQRTATTESPEEVAVTISVTARLSVYEVADLYERIGEVAEFYCGDAFTLRQAGPDQNGRTEADDGR